MENSKSWSDAIDNNDIHEAEIRWMLSKRSLVHDIEQLKVDYGQDKAVEMIEAFEKELGKENSRKYIPALAHHGVGSRYLHFLKWLKKQIDDGNTIADAETAFRGFAKELGRVVSYRALSLTTPQYETIVNANSIYPSGRLKTDDATLDTLVKEKGVTHVAYARLYIGLQLLPYDPSLSLHDDPETAVCIAGGYVDANKKIHLMGMSVPKIEVLGFKVVDLQSDQTRWFAHRGIWFDAFDERTERYCLYEIPFYQERCKSLRIFTNAQEIKEFLEPFKNSQYQKMKASK